MQEILILTKHILNFTIYLSFSLSLVTGTEETRNSPSLSSFKHHLDETLTKSPKFFFDGKRLAQIYHIRLKLAQCASVFQNYHR